MSQKSRVFALTFGALALAGLSACSTFYTSPGVSDGSIFGNAGTDLDVSIVPMTFETTAKANLTTYVPSRLPLGFQPGALRELAPKNVNVPQLGPLPAAPTRSGLRPGFIPDNLPPLETPQPYRIGIADVLLLSVNNTNATLEQLPGLISAQSKRQGFVVQDDGSIAVPDAGRIRVVGLTMQDAEAVIFQALVSAGIDPSFSLEISEFNSQRVSVGGEVRGPTLVPITLKPLYLHEAISSAGGLAVTDPEVAKVQLFRGGTTFQISAKRFLSDPSMRQVVLRDGDSIYVASEFNEERARFAFQERLALRQQQQNQVQFRAQLQAQLESQALNNQIQRETNDIRKLENERALFKDRLELGAVARDYAYLAGEAVVPHRFALPFENKAVLADVLFDQRGLNINVADYGEIYVLRRSTNPEEASLLTAYHLDASNAVNLSLASSFQMHAGDVVFVAEQPITTWNRALSQALPSLISTLANAATNL